jgi:propanol-preferring alcohol dehydrogenase
MTCALGTAYRATVTRGRVNAGSRVGVIGLGGVGIHALQIAHAAAAEAVGFDVSPRSLDAARALGLDARAAEDGGYPAVGEFDVVIDAVGQEATMRQAEQLVRAGGRIVAVGYDAASNFVVPSRRFVLEEVELVGSRYVQRDELERAIQLVADGRVQIVVDAVKPFAEAGDALAALREGGVVGRLVVDVAGVTGTPEE